MNGLVAAGRPVAIVLDDLHTVGSKPSVGSIAQGELCIEVEWSDQARAMPHGRKPNRHGGRGLVALPGCIGRKGNLGMRTARCSRGEQRVLLDRKSTRLNSSHANISYAVFCL